MSKVVYSVIAKCSEGEKDFRKWRKVTYLDKFQKWLTVNFPEWKFYNVYDKKTRELIECVKRHEQ